MAHLSQRRVWVFITDCLAGTLFGFLFLCFVAYLEYRRRVKRAAMERYSPVSCFGHIVLHMDGIVLNIVMRSEKCPNGWCCRYAMKRMRRKFKAMQTENDNRQVRSCGLLSDCSSSLNSLLVRSIGERCIMKAKLSVRH